MQLDRRRSPIGRHSRISLFSVCLAVALIGVPGLMQSALAYPRPGRTDRVSIAPDGTQADGESSHPSLSAGGRFTAFDSMATNLIPGDTNAGDFTSGTDVFVYDGETRGIERVSVAGDGTQAEGDSQIPSITPDGRYVVFQSGAKNLVVPGEVRYYQDIYVHDRQTGETERVTRTASGGEPLGDSQWPSISADGRYVAFQSYARDLVAGDSTYGLDVFVHDRDTGTTERVSVGGGGAEANSQSFMAKISADGRFVTFVSEASNLVTLDTNVCSDRDNNPTTRENCFDVFVHDRVSHTTTRVSVGVDGAEANGHSYEPAISADGRYVAFQSSASNLVPDDENGPPGPRVCNFFYPEWWVAKGCDIFVHDRQTGQTERVSVASDGTEGDGYAFRPSISADGRYVAFDSVSSNLVPGDANNNCSMYSRDTLYKDNCPDIFVHDRVTGSTERASLKNDGSEPQYGGGYGAAISPEGRHVAFYSWEPTMAPPNDTNGDSDVFVRDRGPEVGAGDLTATGSEGVVSVTGWGTFGGAVLESAEDSGNDAGPVAAKLGGELLAASLTYLAEEETLLFRWRLDQLPGTGRPAPYSDVHPTQTGSLAGAPGIVYGVELEAAGQPYEIRVERVRTDADPPGSPTFALYRCEASCQESARLTGGFGTTGKEIRVALPLGVLGIAEGATLRVTKAFTAVTDSAAGPRRELDEVAVDDVVVPEKRVDVAITDPAEPDPGPSDYRPASVANGRFAASFDDGAGAVGDRAWATACLGDRCGTASAVVAGEVVDPDPTPTPTPSPTPTPTPSPTEPPPPPVCPPDDRRVDTFAGNGVGDGSPATNASISHPYSVTADAVGKIYIGDWGNQRVREVGTDGKISTLAKIRSAADVVLGPDGDLYVAEYVWSRIRKVDLETGEISIVAGTGTDGAEGDGGPATEANLNGPAEIAFDAAGNLFIADYQNHRVRRVDAVTGIITTVAGNGTKGYAGDGGPATEASLRYPDGLAFGADGDLFISDTNNNRIRRVDAGTRVITTFAGNGTAGYTGDGVPATLASLDKPTGLSFGSEGSLYVADFGNDRIRKVSPQGIITTAVGSGAPASVGDGAPGAAAGVNGPLDVAFVAGSLYIAEEFGHRIRMVDSLGRVSTVAGTGSWSYGGDGGPATEATFWSPKRVATDASGNVYIADTLNQRIRRVDAATGVITTVAGNGIGAFAGDGGPATLASLNTPYAVEVDAAGNVYIADTGNNRVRRVDTSGRITTVAGNGGPVAVAPADGAPALAASLSSPRGLALDAAGNLYIADTGHARVRKVDASTGLISTVAGNGTAAFAGDGGAATSASLNGVRDVTFDGAGNLYIADATNRRIRRVDASTGIISTVAGDGTRTYPGDGNPATEAGLNEPHDVAVSAAGNLYIVDREDHSIRAVDLGEGTISTLAGDGTRGFSGDGGPPGCARLALPNGIALHPDGTLYIAELGNHLVRRISGVT